MEPTAAAISQGRAAARSKTGAGQASAQAPQKLHSPRPKSTSGKPPSPGRRMPSGQAPWQAPQRVHSEVNRSSRDQGGRIVGGEALVRPRRNHPSPDINRVVGHDGVPIRSDRRRARRPHDHLRYPNEEPVSAHDGNSQERPDHEREQEENEDFPAFRRRVPRAVCAELSWRIAPCHLDGLGDGLSACCFSPFYWLNGTI